MRYLSLFCGLLHKTPDQLASVSSIEALEIQIQLATAMEQELKLKRRSITQRLNALHSFWRANNVQLTDEVMTYKGTPSLRRAVKAPES
jgi:muramoyltetrapeptide carboxypeptidase LdcA involved in peptidoglycan recycling